jgi:hypothetical protein
MSVASSRMWTLSATFVNRSFASKTERMTGGTLVFLLRCMCVIVNRRVGPPFRSFDASIPTFQPHTSIPLFPVNNALCHDPIFAVCRL